MMNLSINSIVTLGICFIVGSCTSTKKALRPGSLITVGNKGILSITEKSYSAVRSGDSILLAARSRRFDFESDFVRYYDHLGRLSKEQNFKSDGSFKNELLYKYSSLNDTVYTFRKEGLDSSFVLFETRYIDSNGIATILYDWKYYLEVRKKNRGKEISNNYKLNKTGANSGFQYIPESKGKYELIHTFIYYYDRKNNLKRDLTLNPDGTLWSSTERRFDKHNNEIKRKEYFPKEHNKYRTKSEVLNYTYLYNYNDKGDWIKRVEYLNGNLTYVLIRQIEYY
jgi:hypothetical protein